MKKTRHPQGWVMSICFLLTIPLLFLTSAWLSRGEKGAVLTSSPPSSGTPTSPPTVVIDAGHGGEDGGTSSASGLVEKDVNLALAFQLRDLLELNGIPTIMTRTEDILLYNRNVDFKGRKKVLDLAARSAIANNTPNCILVSIHMNAYPDPQYHGLQVWYSPHDEDSKLLAELVQNNAKTLQPDNHRGIKASGSNIYLLHHATYPAILVECGFLSNPQEAANLSKDAYRRALAMVIFQGIMAYIGS